MYIHNLNPIIFDFGILSLRWYSLAYILGIVFGWWYGKKIIFFINNQNKKNYNLDLFDDYTNVVTLIEWPQIIKEKPNDLIELTFEYGKDYQTRSVQIKGLNL